MSAPEQSPQTSTDEQPTGALHALQAHFEARREEQALRFRTVRAVALPVLGKHSSDKFEDFFQFVSKLTGVNEEDVRHTMLSLETAGEVDLDIFGEGFTLNLERESACAAATVETVQVGDKMLPSEVLAALAERQVELDANQTQLDQELQAFNQNFYTSGES